MSYDAGNPQVECDADPGRICDEIKKTAAGMFNDAYWLRMFYAHALSTANLWMRDHKTAHADLLECALKALSEIKKHEGKP